MHENKDLVKWADNQQYWREPIPEKDLRKIRVSLINATPDPLGGLVVLNGIYKGEVIRSLADPRVTDDARRQALEDLTKTALSGPMESIQFHFLIEGLTRSITHQMVRSRFSFFAQESLRFAVPEGNWTQEIPRPPSIESLPEDDWRRREWNLAIETVADAYQALVNSGIPAEEARDLLPHAMPTRIHWVMDLRTLLLEAGKRTCTQAQFPWRVIFAGIAEALRRYAANDQPMTPENDAPHQHAWQYYLIAEKIRPVCYQAGRCTFMAQFDRDCSIRDRVEQFSEAGIPSSEWSKGKRSLTIDPLDRKGTEYSIKPIQDWEWAANPGAARRVGEK